MTHSMKAATSDLFPRGYVAIAEPEKPRCGLIRWLQRVGGLFRNICKPNGNRLRKPPFLPVLKMTKSTFMHARTYEH